MDAHSDTIATPRGASEPAIPGYIVDAVLAEFEEPLHELKKFAQVAAVLAEDMESRVIHAGNRVATMHDVRADLLIYFVNRIEDGLTELYEAHGDMVRSNTTSAVRT